MDTMKLEQHWFGSAPVGLELPRGLQTIAHSKGLGDFTALKAHSAYRPPAGTAEKDMPINWGWFWLDDNRACVHRIAYSGTDEMGRAGNYMAHNLVIRREDLDRIDYDIPCLLGWIREQSRFIRNYRLLYQALDPGKDRPDKSRLRMAPVLEVPVAEVQQLRARMDASWESQFLDALQPDLVAVLLRVLVCPSDQRQPFLLIGAEDGSSDPDLALKVVAFLFTLLPSHCRHKLTFATYDHLASSLLEPPKPGTEPPPPSAATPLLCARFDQPEGAGGKQPSLGVPRAQQEGLLSAGAQ